MEDTANVSKMKKKAEKELSWQVEVYLIFTRTRRMGKNSRGGP